MTAGRLVLAAAVALVVDVLLSLWPPLGPIDPLLVVAVVAALPGRPGAALAAGLLTGLVEDAWGGGWFGQHALTHTVVAYAFSLVAARVDLAQLRPAALAFAVATVADWGLQIALAALFDRPVGRAPGPVTWIVATAGNTMAGLVARRLAPPAAGRR